MDSIIDRAHAVPPTALVTGGCGFVGRHLVAELLRRGYSVWIADDLSTGKHPDEWLGAGWQRTGQAGAAVAYAHGQQRVLFSEGDLITLLYQLDPVDPFLRANEIARIDDVFHLASVVGGRTKIEGDPMAVAIDLAIDATFFRWIVRNRERVGRVLFASSSAAYPIHLQADQGAIALKEAYISFDENLGQPDMTYGWSKLSGEYLARIAAQHYGVHVACVRPFSGYGGDQDGSYPVPAIARRAAQREDPLIVWGTGEQGRDFVHIDDCIDAMLVALEKISDGTGVNIGSGQLTTFKQLAQLFAELAGYTPTVKPLIDKPMGVHSRYADTTEMEARLGWRPRISLRDGMRRVLNEQLAQVTEVTP
jgi:nucleoside-diphosphate-sugar epimerase